MTITRVASLCALTFPDRGVSTGLRLDTRELRRNADAQGGYSSQHAMLSHARRRAAARRPRKLTWTA